MKAVLVVDIPNSYGDVYDNKAVVTLRNGKLGKCLGIYNVPLKPLPCKKHMRQMPSDVLEKGKRKRDFIIYRVDVDNAYAMGWNDCIEYLMTGKDADAELNDLLGEILGETE